MALVFAAIVPHSPIFIPDIGKDNLAELQHTIQALQQISKQLVMASPETIICITNHPVGKENLNNALVFNLNSHYQTNFEEFGEYGNTFMIPGDPALTYHLKHRFDSERDKYPIAVTSEQKLDGSISSPLFYLLKGQPNIHLVPMSDTIEDDRPEFVLGGRLRRPIYQEKKRIGLFAIMNLSHRLNDKSPAGYSPKAKSFDQRVIAAITKNKVTTLLRLKKETLLEVKECAVRPLLLLFGILKNTNYTPDLLSYESPFGIGHAVINLKL